MSQKRAIPDNDSAARRAIGTPNSRNNKHARLHPFVKVDDANDATLYTAV